MGHIHLPTLPKTKPWREVVALLDDGATDDAVIAGAAIAAEKEIRSAADDPVYVEALRLLAMIPQAARSEDFGAALRTLGLSVPERALALDLLAAVGRRLDEVALANGRSDFGELSRRAAIAVVSAEIVEGSSGLFGSDHDDLRLQAARLSRPPEFARVTRLFLGQLVTGSLSSWLDRVLATRIGPEARFEDVAGRASFDAALAQYCSESTRIVQEFAAGWYGKTLWREGEITSDRAAVFGYVALKKIGEELRRKRDG